MTLSGTEVNLRVITASRNLSWVEFLGAKFVAAILSFRGPSLLVQLALIKYIGIRGIYT